MWEKEDKEGYVILASQSEGWSCEPVRFAMPIGCLTADVERQLERQVCSAEERSGLMLSVHGQYRMNLDEITHPGSEGRWKR